jgi:type I restriction enzyme S subunit
MQKVKLGDVATYLNGYAFKPTAWGRNGLPIIRIQNLTKSSGEINYYDGEINSKYIINNGDVLISWSASLGVYIWQGGKALLNQHIFKVVFDKIEIIKEFFVYAIGITLREMIKNTHGSTMKHITKKRFDNVEIPLLPLPIQKKIVDVLDKAQELIDLRKKQIELLDDLIQSTFYDMFGDPVTNPMGWKKVSFASLLAEKPMNGYFAKNDKYVDEGNAEVVWIGDFIDKFYCDTDNLRQVFANEKEIEKYLITYGDVLFCRSSLNVAGIGKAAFVPKHSKNLMFECHVIRCKLVLEKMIPEFFRILSDSKFFRNQVMRNSKTSTMTTIGQDGITKCLVVVPPIDLQNQFAEKVEKIEQQKSKMQDSLLLLENNFNSIMQRAFNGALFAG